MIVPDLTGAAPGERLPDQHAAAYVVCLTSFSISSASTTAVIDRLEGVGLVTRQGNDRDRRSLAVVPGDRRIDPEQIDPPSERIAALTVDLDDERAEVICQFLARLPDAVDSECQEPESRWQTASR